MTLRDDRPAIARRVYALLLLLDVKWDNGLTLERVANNLERYYFDLKDRPHIAGFESGEIRVMRDRDLGKLDVYVRVGAITHESPPCTCEEGELLDVDCVVHRRRVPA